MAQFCCVLLGLAAGVLSGFLGMGGRDSAHPCLYLTYGAKSTSGPRYDIGNYDTTDRAFGCIKILL